MGRGSLDVGRALILSALDKRAAVIDAMSSRIAGHPVLSQVVALWDNVQRKVAYAPDGVNGSSVDSPRSLVQQFVSPNLRRDKQDVRIAHEQLLVLTSNSSNPDQLRDLLEETSQKLLPNSRLIWLHFEMDGEAVLAVDEAKSMCDGRSGGGLFYHVKQKTWRHEHLDLKEEEVGAIAFQWAEHVVLRAKELERRGERGLAMAALELDRDKAFAFLVRQALLKQHERENVRLPIDEVNHDAMMALDPHLDTYRSIRDQIVAEASEPFVVGFKNNEDLERFDVHDRLVEYEREGIDKSDAFEEVNEKCKAVSKAIWTSIAKKLGETKTVSERLSLVRAMLGLPDELVRGRPHRSTTVLDDLEHECLQDLLQCGIPTDGLPSLEELAHQRTASQEAWDAVLQEEEDLDVEQELDSSKAADEALMEKLRATHKGALQKHEESLRSRIAARKVAFGLLNVDTLRRQLKKIADVAKIEPLPLPEPLEPVFAPQVKQWMLRTLVPLVVWMVLGWELEFVQFFLPLSLFSVCALTWVVIIAKRLSRKPPRIPDNMGIALEAYSAAAKQIFEVKRNFWVLAAFEDHFEREVRRKLRGEKKVLKSMHSEFNKHVEKHMDEMVDFSSLNRAEELTSKESLGLYFEKELQAKIERMKSLSDFRSASSGKSVENGAVVKFMEGAAREFVQGQAVEFNEFDITDLLRGHSDWEPPVFIKEELPSVEALFSRVRVHFDAMHDRVQNEKGVQFIYFNHSDDESRQLEMEGILNAQLDGGEILFKESKSQSRVGFFRELELVPMENSNQNIRSGADSDLVKLKFSKPPQNEKGEDSSPAVSA